MFQPVDLTMIVSVIYKYVASGKELVNDFFVAKEDPWNDADVLSTLEQAAAFAASEFAPLTSDFAVVDHVYGRDLQDEFAVGQVLDVSEAGQDGSTPTPVNVAAWVKFRGTSGSPPRHGGIFFPFVPEESVDGPGNIADAWRTSVQGACNDFMNGVRAGVSPESQWVIVSRFSKTAWIAAHPAATPAEIELASPWPRPAGVTSAVQSAVTRKLCGSQRDRRG